MAALTFAIALLILTTLGETRKLYYPDTKDPNAIVFEGPTNYKEPDAGEITDNEVTDPDFSELIDVRTKIGTDEIQCPEGFVVVGGLCFPND